MIADRSEDSKERTSFITEQYDSLEEIEVFYVKMLWKMREEHSVWICDDNNGFIYTRLIRSVIST